jgi:hypothetical protein
VDLNHLCAELKGRVALELCEAAGPAERCEILIAALYELSRSVLPALGPPRKSEEYLARQAVVLDLISSIAIALIRGAEQQRRGVSVLSEIGEGCLDPLLKKKLSVYAQELLAKSVAEAGKPASINWRSAAGAVGCCATAAVLVYLTWPASPAPAKKAVLPVAAASQTAPAATEPSAPALNCPVGGATVEAAAKRERSEDEPKKVERPVAEPGAAAQRGEQITRVRIVDNQVLVPVTLKKGAESVRIELLLDTGATRTVVHESAVSRLQIDLRSARTSLAEVADGSVIRSRIAKIDTLAVGPFSQASVEVELIPYSGGGAPHDGLLGMDFLGRHRYQIDMEHEMIRWF